jgi:S1-C subfamily serine protease
MISTMKCAYSKEFFRFAIFVLISIVAGAGSGALAGWIAGSVRQQLMASEPTPVVASSTSTESGIQTTSTVPQTTEQKLTVVQVDQIPPEAIVPPAFSGQETSVAVLYKKPAKGIRVFRDEDALGQAVAVTSDGWFVAPFDSIESLRMAEVVLWYQGKAFVVTRGVADHRGSVAFLKVDSKDTKAPSFARFQDVTKGLSVWVERRPGSFEPPSIMSLVGEVDGLIGDSSDIGARRPLLSSLSSLQDSGAPVWAGNGSLVGLISVKKEGASRFIPSSAWAPSLFGIFSDGVIAHATLGVTAVDLSSVRLVTSIEGLPERGAWIVSDGTKNPVITAGSPAEKAGLKEGDVITQVDYDILDGRADLGEILIQYKPNASVTLKVVRDGQTIDVPVMLGSKVVSEEMK